MSKPTKIQQLIYSMLTEGTGAHMLDSGGAYGRHWERNQKHSIEYFIKQPDIEAGIESWGKENPQLQYEYTINVFAYLSTYLQLDDLCDQFNSMSVDDWDGENYTNSDASLYGVSQAGAEWLEAQGFHPQATINTYNHDSNLSQVLQYTYLSLGNSGDTHEYVLLQIHNGCDVRGGYTDAKLFQLNPWREWLAEDVYGTYNGKHVSNTYDGWRITYDDDGDSNRYGQEIEPVKDGKLELWLAE